MKEKNFKKRTVSYKLLILFLVFSMMISTCSPAFAITQEYNLDKAEIVKIAEVNGAQVKVSYDMEAFDQEVDLKIHREGQVKNDANMISYDIKFVDPKSQDEVEPKTPVDVSLQVDDSILPDNADPSSIEIRHMIEGVEGNIEKVETVAKAQNFTENQGQVVVREGKIIANFRTDSFSSFIIGWDNVENKVTNPYVRNKSYLRGEGNRVGSTIEKSKTVSEQNEDGSYDITISFSSTPGIVEIAPKVDVMFLLDQSNSMDEDFGNWPNQKHRMTCAQKVINAMVSELAKKHNAGKIDARYSMVTFSGDKGSTWNRDKKFNDAKWKVDWTSDANTFKNSVNSISTHGGTNYQAALIMGKKHMSDEARPDARKVVVFMSDGEPTYYYDEYGYTAGTGNTVGKSLSHALITADEIVADNIFDHFYTVGIGGNVSIYENLEKLNQVFVKANNVVTKPVYHGENPDALEGAFAEITSEVLNIQASGVTVVDPISSAVNITGVDGAENASIYIKNEDGEIVAEGKVGQPISVEGGEIIAVYDSNTENVKMVFPEDYELKAGYTYELKINVMPDMDMIANADEFPDRAIDHNGKPVEPEVWGFHTNGNASITYSGEDSGTTSESFGKPVLRCKKAKFKKIFEGLTEEEINGLKGVLKFNVNITDEEDKPFQTKEVTFNDENFVKQEDGSYLYKGGLLSVLPDKCHVVITEKDGTGAVENYTYTATTALDDNKLDLTDNQRCKEYDLTNKYTRKTVNLNIKKLVAGNMGDLNSDYIFTLKLKDGEDIFTDFEYLKELNPGLDESNWSVENSEFSFKLQHEAAKNFVVPKGIDYQITEKSCTSDGYTTTVTVNGDEANPDEYIEAESDQNVVFTNTKDCQPSTGIHRDIMCYLVMAAIGVAIIVYLKNRRKA